MQKKITHSLRLLADAFDRYKDIALFSSFGKDSVVILDLARRINPNVQVISIMTPYKFQVTRQYKDYLSRKWGLNIKTYEQPLIAKDKKNLYETDPEACCEYFKVSPTRQAIKEFKLDAWITGLRNTEGGDMREKFSKEVEIKEDGLVKINPILTWTEKDIWLYHAMNGITVNPLYIQGYRSLGCEPCTKICNDDSESERAGRWAGVDKIECGIHSEGRLRS